MRVLSISILILLSASSPPRAQEEATPEEVVQLVREAAAFLSEKGEPGLATFRDKATTFVFKNSFVFVFDCYDYVLVAAPTVKPGGTSLLHAVDATGAKYFLAMCGASRKSKGGWSVIYWPAPGEAKVERRLAFTLQVPHRPYQLGAWTRDDRYTLLQLEALLAGD